ncbi:phosphoenolpyruvate--protein phosphotransferase [Sphingomonas koreensis]|nr:phosphoenolpyruvate--protein phosphotransferase [Sphingomonas koreensis]
MSTIILSSPLRGWAAPLDEVPDPVFAGRMLGDGVAIEPTGSILHAPCDGQIISLHASLHAITLRSTEGAELLIHIGVDSVALGGEGFVTKVAEGDFVHRGDPMIEFDLDALLLRVPSVITPILVNNPDQYEIVRRDVDRAVKVGELLMTLAPRTATAAETVITGDEHRCQITVPMVHGIHARPAGRIAECARGFKCDLSFEKEGRTANARSAVSLLTLGVKFGDTIEISAKGEDADDALTALCTLVRSGMGEGGERASTADGNKVRALHLPPPPALPADGRIFAVQAAPGLAVGQVVWLREIDSVVPENGVSASVERARLESALVTAVERLAQASGNAATVLEAHQALLQDPELRDGANHAIDEGRSAEHAWRSALRTYAALLRGLGDARMAERADDLLDVERQVLAVLTGREISDLSFPPDTILLAEDLLPSDLIRIGPGGIAGFCTVRGGPTSHVAILAASMAIPGLVAAGLALASVPEGADVILDAQAASLRVNPNIDELAATHFAIARDAEQRAEAMARAQMPAVTRDNVAIEVFANLASVADASVAVVNGAEGCGLLRTEFLFLDRLEAPDEAEQAADYQAIADALEGRPLIVRLLDIGGDKPAPYLPIAAEENPALGLRGIRVGLAHRDLLDAQLRAILRVHPVGQCRIMVPMVSSVAELLLVREALDEARAALGIAEPVALGVMIETPAAAITADLIAAHADFLSIGTNDLTQYVLAMDRGNPAVAAGIDAFHPAVLRMIARTCEGGGRHGRWTGMCGGLASDPLAAPILIGLGVSELSVTTALVPQVKAAVRAVSSTDCRRLAQEALDLPSASAVRELARRFQKELAQ